MSSTNVGIVYDDRMLLHRGNSRHPERPERVKVIYENLRDTGLLKRKNVVELEGREATPTELERCHDKRYIKRIRNQLLFDYTVDTKIESSLSNDMFASRDSYTAALVSAGCAISLADAFLQQKITCGFAIVRPPSHHSKCGNCGGFCYFNGTALTAVKLSDAGKKVLIVDIDCHLGNGTVNVLKSSLHKRNESIRYFSIHRWDLGQFYPGGKQGQSCDIRSRIALVGFNGPQGDDYYAEQFLRYFTDEKKEIFQPDVIVVSAGFDSAIGDPVGQCFVTANGYRQMTRTMLEYCPNVLMVLEGGYNLESLATCSYACIDEMHQFVTKDFF